MLRLRMEQLEAHCRTNLIVVSKEEIAVNDESKMSKISLKLEIFGSPNVSFDQKFLYLCTPQ